MIRKGDDLGMTPLHFAALYGRIEVVKLFVEYDNSAIYVMNNGGQSALHLAAYSGHIKILQQLVNCRPDCYKMVDKMGRTALHAAVLGKQKETIKFILETPSFEWLFNMADNDGNTPLHLAADFKFIQIIQTFSSNTKVRFDILNNKFWTPVRVYTRYNPVRFLSRLFYSFFLSWINGTHDYQTYFGNVYNTNSRIWNLNLQIAMLGNLSYCRLQGIFNILF